MANSKGSSSEIGMGYQKEKFRREGGTGKRKEQTSNNYFEVCRYNFSNAIREPRFLMG